MRIAVLGGGGAMGGLFGGWLAMAGQEVVLVDVAQSTAAAINQGGLTIAEKDGTERHAAVPASADPAEVGPVDLILVFVKGYHTASAMAFAAPMLGPDTAVLTLQNGWGNAAAIEAGIGSGRVLAGLTYYSATLEAPGRIGHPGIGPTLIGELDGSRSSRVERAC